MANLDNGQSLSELCGGVPETLRRRDYLKVVSSLPHLDFLPRHDLGLARTIEAEIIPRLMLVHAADARAELRIKTQTRSVTTAERENFCKAICLGTVDEACAFITALHEEGVSIEAVLLDLLAPTAKKLGEMWEEDDVDFACVTIALCCLQKVLRHVSGNLADEAAPRKESGYRALLATPRREQHIFGLLIIDDFFWRAGWDVWTMPSASDDELVDVVRRESFHIAGLSTSTESSLLDIERLISAMRRGSKNRGLVVFVGGRVFAERPELVRVVGADGTATDGREVVERATQHVEDRGRI